MVLAIAMQFYITKKNLPSPYESKDSIKKSFKKIKSFKNFIIHFKGALTDKLDHDLVLNSDDFISVSNWIDKWECLMKEPYTLPSTNY